MNDVPGISLSARARLLLLTKCHFLLPSVASPEMRSNTRASAIAVRMPPRSNLMVLPERLLAPPSVDPLMRLSRPLPLRLRFCDLYLNCISLSFGNVIAMPSCASLRASSRGLLSQEGSPDTSLARIAALSRTRSFSERCDLTRRCHSRSARDGWRACFLDQACGR